MSPSARADMLELTWFDDPVAYGLDRAGAPGPKWAYLLGSLPIAVGGLVPGRPGVVSAWFIGTAHLDFVGRDTALDLWRASRMAVRRALEVSGVHRVEAWVRADWTAAVAFARAVGLKQEGEHRGATAAGATMLSFASLRRADHGRR